MSVTLQSTYSMRNDFGVSLAKYTLLTSIVFDDIGGSIYMFYVNSIDMYILPVSVI